MSFTIRFVISGCDETTVITANSIKVVRKKRERSNMSGKGLSGMTSFISEHITSHSLKLNVHFL